MSFAAALLALAAAVRQEPAADPSRVRDLVRKLDSELPDARDEAEAELRKIGRPARGLLGEAAKGASDETAGRIRSVLRGFALLDQEEYAFERLRKADPFPARRVGKIQLDAGTPLAEVLAQLARAYDVKIEFYPGDDELRERFGKSRLEGTHYTNDEYLPQLIPGLVSNAFDAFCVIDGARVVIVRLTPSLLIERLRIDRDDSLYLEIPRKLSEFHDKIYAHGLTAGSFLQGRAALGGARRDRWADVLATVALSETETVERRRAAVSGFRFFYGVEDTPQPRAAEVLVRINADRRTPPELRAETARVLCWSTDAPALDAIQKTLESGPAAEAGAILAGLVEVHWAGLAAPARIFEDPARSGPFERALEALEKSADPDVALRATSLRATLSFRHESHAVAIERLIKAPDPHDPRTLEIFLEGLRVAAFKRPALVTPRIEQLSRHADPRLRACAASLFGRSVGGTGRKGDVDGSLALLHDPESIVRWAAAEAIRFVYSYTAAERYLDGWESVEPKLVEALKNEKHPKVRAALEKALEEGRK